MKVHHIQLYKRKRLTDFSQLAKMFLLTYEFIAAKRMKNVVHVFPAS